MATLNKIENVKDDIKLRIFEGKFLPGDLIYERKIAKLYKISRGTARKALIELEKQDLLSIIPSVGYKINKRKVDPILVENGFKKDLESVYGENFEKNRKSNFSYSKIIADQYLESIFDISNESYIICVKYLRLTDDGDIKSIVFYYIPYFLVKTSLPISIETFDTVLDSMNSKIHTIRATVKLISPKKEIQNYLKLEADINKVIKRECRFITKNQKVLFYTVEFTKVNKSVDVLPSNQIFRKVEGFLE